MSDPKRGAYLELISVRQRLIHKKFERRARGLTPELTDAEEKIVRLCEYAADVYQRERFGTDYPLIYLLEKML